MKVKINTNPPGHQPTEEEFRIAYLTYVLQYLCYELLLDMQPQDVKIIENMFCGDEDDEREIWERKFPYEDFRKRYLKYAPWGLHLSSYNLHKMLGRRAFQYTFNSRLVSLLFLQI